MGFKYKFKEWLRCKIRGHRYLIDRYDKQGAVYASQCIHCNKLKKV